MTTTPAPNAPKTKVAATVLLERFHRRAGELAAIEAARSSQIAATNAVADKLAAPVLTELQQLRDRLEPWWAANAADLTGGKRKSIELGGCDIGTKRTKATLEHGFADDDAAIAALEAERWAKSYLTVKVTLDRTATLKAVESGKHQDRLVALGFKVKPGADAFFVKRVAQGGVLTDPA